MATQSPFLLLESLVGNIAASLPVPSWAVEEVQRRVVLLLNHVLMQEQEATARLIRQSGRVVLVQWRSFSLRLLVTPAGLLDLAGADAPPDLSLVVTEEYATSIAQALLRGDKPAVRIEGDVQLAAEVSWLAENVRWDIEEDLSRLVGDAPAHVIGEFARRIAQAVQQFTGVPRGSAGKGGAPV